MMRVAMDLLFFVALHTPDQTIELSWLKEAHHRSLAVLGRVSGGFHLNELKGDFHATSAHPKAARRYSIVHFTTSFYSEVEDLIEWYLNETKGRTENGLAESDGKHILDFLSQIVGDIRAL
jgi:hypothetical protein